MQEIVESDLALLFQYIRQQMYNLIFIPRNKAGQPDVEALF